MIIKDHPRSRGNHFDCVYNWDHNLGSPPLAREPHTSCAVNALACGITPARAGTTTGNFTRPKIDRDHPRSRGNHVEIRLHAVVIVGSPPLAREPQIFSYRARLVNGITPARAGTTMIAGMSDPPI